MARDEAAIEQEIQAKGLNAPRLTPQYIDSQIVGEYFTRASDAFKGCPVMDELKCLTICVLVLKNGFMVTGESACASPENFDEEIGRKIARDNARNKIWALEGYQLRSRLAHPGPEWRPLSIGFTTDDDQAMKEASVKLVDEMIKSGVARFQRAEPVSLLTVNVVVPSTAVIRSA